MDFNPYPFEKLNDLLQGMELKADVINLTIGEPQFETPGFILDALQKHAHEFNKYPKSAGEDFLKEAVRTFINKRFFVDMPLESLVPTFGTREVLFNLPQFLLASKKNPTIAFTNPFYQIYEGAAIASGAKMQTIALEDYDTKRAIKEAKGADVVILNFPNNPTGATLSLDELQMWADAARKENFVIISDECYSEIYRDKQPNSILEVQGGCENIIAVNSLSKRSSCAGLRAGFVCGDKKLLKGYKLYRTYVGCALPLPLQRAAAAAWEDFEAADAIRLKYKKNMELAEEILGIKAPDATFYLWLKVKDDLLFAKIAYEDYALKLLPGSYLGRNGEGSGYIRAALVYEGEKMREGLERLKEVYERLK